MLLSVVIPAYNEEELLAESLSRIQNALQESGLGPTEWEVIVCDNNSSDRTTQIASAAGATVVKEPVNQISRARNTGAKAARGRWLLFIDADSYPTSALIREMLDLIQGGQHIGCGSTVRVTDGPLWSKLRIERLNPLMRLLNCCGGAFLLCQRKAFREIGGFSTDLHALEDIDFVLRLRRYGKKARKKFKVLHRHPVITSGRKGKLSLRSILSLLWSIVLSVLLLLLHFVLPRRWRVRGNSRWFGFWYRR